MAIHTEKPGGGDDLVAVHRAHSADEARRARAALEAVGVRIDLPDQAIDAFYAAKPDAILPIRVALKDSPKAIKAISDAIPREEAPSPILAAANKNEAAAATLVQDVAPAPTSDPNVLPASAVDKSAQRAVIISCFSILCPPLGFVGAVWSGMVLLEMSKRPNDLFRRKVHAQAGVALGILTGVLATPYFVAIVRKALGH